MPAKAPTNLLCEYTVNPLGIDVVKPRFSWIPDHTERGQFQSAYQVLVASSKENLEKEEADMWNSGKVESDNSVNVVYEGKALESGKTYYWKVRYWDKEGKVSPYSQIARFEMGLLRKEDWEAEWITGGNLLRKEFVVDKDIKRARAYICGLGYYELRINGKKVGDHVLDPGWTDYDKRVLYVTYDITWYLRKGKNAVGVMLGNGRYSPLEDTIKRSSVPLRKYGDSPILLLQIHIDFLDGSYLKIVTDESWKATQGPIVRDDIYDGEIYDARFEKSGWDMPFYDDSKWSNAKKANPPKGKLVSQATFPPIKVIKKIQPRKIINPKPDVFVYDFEQNFTGWVKLKVKGKEGTKVTLRYAELLNDDGMINTRPNRAAKATDVYILKGNGEEIYEPRFTYHGFRYVELTGFPGTPTLDNIEGCVVHSAVEPTGGFSCSNPLINRIHQNIIWGQVSNLMSVPTDCPQRDERMGWMGDAQLTVEEAIYNFDMASFYTKWIYDIKEAQKEDGAVPDVVPPYWSLYPADPAWGTAWITIPWYLYLYYEDKRILEECYSGMKAWVEFLISQAKDHLLLYGKYGDWCPPRHVRSPDTPFKITSTWYYYHDTLILSKIAHILGKKEDAERYLKLSEKIKEAFNKEFFQEDRYCGEKYSQTANILPLYLDMVPEDKKDAVLKSLVKDALVTHSAHLNTGIVGTRYLFDVLTEYGYTDLAYKIVTQTTYPSWGYMIKEGATTLWERWEYLANSGMNSHNHIMFGSVDTFFYKTLAGICIDPSSPGFKKIIIKPFPVGDLKYVNASIKTIKGVISSNWERTEGFFNLRVSVPVNTKATINVPKMGLKNVLVKEKDKLIWENGSFLKEVPGIIEGREDKDYVIFEVGSGEYHFQVSEK